MKKQLIIALCFVASILAGTNSVLAGSSPANTSLTFLSVPINARSGGMGEMGVATTPDLYSHYTNSAKYAFLNESWKGGLNLAYTPWLRNIVDDMDIAGVSGYYRVNELSTFSTSFRYFNMGSMEFINQDQQVIGSHSPYELAFDLSYTRKLSNTFAMSVAFRYAASNIAGNVDSYYDYQTAHSVSVDVNAYFQKTVGNNNLISAGAAVTNIGTRLDYGDDRKYFLPAQFKLGINYLTTFTEEHSLSFGVEFDKYLVSTDADDYDKSVFGNMGASLSGGKFFKEMLYKVGAEYGYRDFLFGRLGYSYEDMSYGNQKFLTFGMGVVYKILHFDVSYLVPTSTISVNPMENTIRLSLGINF